MAERIARVAERTRSAMTRKWFGEDPGPWNPRCNIYVYATAAAHGSGTGGVSFAAPGQGLVLGNKALVAEVFAKNGYLVLSSGTGGEKTAEVNAERVGQGKEGDDSRQIEHALLDSRL